MNASKLVAASLEKWKENLLDTSKRNRLLYFKPDSAVQLLEPDLEELWKRLVIRGQSQSLFGLESENELFAETESDGELDLVPRKGLKSDEIRPNLSGTKLARTLYTLRAKSNLSVEEQGFTTLYVAWGFLKWRDAKTNEELTSPILLSPMTLLRESAKSAYRLKLYEETLWLNPVLEWKLAADFKLQLDKPGDAEDEDLFAYLDRVRTVIEKQVGWSVWEAAYLGLYSFHKMAMYQDLRDNHERALAHPYVCALGGDSSALPPVPAAIPHGRDLDHIPIQDNFSVLDCDSSQGDAVQAARAGVSFVLQGPPGTGKSQTITNIISECMAAGKRVLFVSEKMAALDVVHSRLEAAGLGLFCLKAHSQSATKKGVIEDLGKTLAAARTGSELAAASVAARHDSSQTEELEKLRQGLNLYAQELHKARSPLNRSVFEVAGELANRNEAAEVAVPLPHPFSQDLSTFNGWRNALKDALAEETVWSRGTSHPWYGAKAAESSFDLAATIRFRGERAARGSLACAASARDLARLLGLEEQNYALNQADMLPELAALVAELGNLRVPAMWFVLEDLEPHFRVAREFKQRFQSVASRRAHLNEHYASGYWDLPHPELIEIVKVRYQATLGRTGSWEAFPVWYQETVDRLETVAGRLESARLATSAMARRLGLPEPETLARVGQFAQAMLVLQKEFVASRRRVRRNWFDNSQQVALRNLCLAARSHVEARDKAAGNLGEYNLEAMLSADLKGMSSRFETEYTSFLRLLKSGYRSDCKQLAAWRKDGKKPPYYAAVAGLQQAVIWQEHQVALNLAALEHENAFGMAYTGPSTDWGTIESDLAACHRLSEALAPLGGVTRECAGHLENGDGIAEAMAVLEGLMGTLRPLKEEMEWLGVVFSLERLPFEKDGVALTGAHAPMVEYTAWLREQKQNLDAIEGGFRQWLNVRHNNELLPEQLVRDATEAIAILNTESELEAERPQLEARFDILFNGHATEWDEVLRALDWTSRVLFWWRRFAEAGGITGEGAQAVPGFIQLVTVQSSLEEVGGPVTRLADELHLLNSDWAYFNALFEHPAGPLLTLESDANWLNEHSRAAGEIDDYLRWRRQEVKLGQLALMDFWREARRRELPGGALLEAFERRFWSLWMDGALRESERLREFAGVRHSASAERFSRLDEESLKAARRRLADELWKKKPVSSTGVARGGEIATLQKEVVKKARHRPLRWLFREIPHLFAALKPCVLMSPLAVAQFLEAERAQFDLVIFDEASQICPEDAVGSILRAKQLIVVGDRRQLPPSKFFSSSTIFDEDTDEETEDGIYESILDMCAPHLSNFMLLWHYRSRHEALISFSNKHFYDGRLITFPGPHVGGAHGRGVRLEHVHGIYHRGQGRDARTNPIEAKRVAELVMEHFERAPLQSLGVIALNAQHARAIDEAVRREILERPELEALLDEGKRERFFVKALENVQGDERDAIILSIGYGPDSEGKITMNFGPINKEGGERRLNVAVTRARDALTVVSSLQPENIDTSKILRQGPKLLRSYLEMARRGGDVQEMDLEVAHEFFVDAVELALQSKGWRTFRGIGRSALRIDIGIEHPDKPGVFLMGIECDGRDYGSAPTARDRERLRPAVLQGLGWRLHRVWCLDWLRRPADELEKLDLVLRDVLASDRIQIEREKELSVPAVDLVLPDSEAHEITGTGMVEIQVLDETTPHSGIEEDLDDGPGASRLLRLDDVVPVSPTRDGLPEYKPVNLGILGWQEDFRALTPDSLKLRNEVFQVVNAEGPVAVATIVRRVAAAYGFGRAGATIQQVITEAIRRDKRIQIRDEFAWLTGMTEAPLRVAVLDGELRTIDEVCLEELEEAAAFCLREAFGMEWDELVLQSARLLGWQRVGEKVGTRIRTAINLALARGRFLEINGAIRLS